MFRRRLPSVWLQPSRVQMVLARLPSATPYGPPRYAGQRINCMGDYAGTEFHFWNLRSRTVSRFEGDSERLGGDRTQRIVQLHQSGWHWLRHLQGLPSGRFGRFEAVDELRRRSVGILSNSDTTRLLWGGVASFWNARLVPPCRCGFMSRAGESRRGLPSILGFPGSRFGRRTANKWPTVGTEGDSWGIFHNHASGAARKCGSAESKSSMAAPCRPQKQKS